MQDQPHIQQLEDITSGYQRAQVLFTALRARLFEQISSPRSSEEVAASLGWSTRGTRMLLDGLLAIGLVEKHGALYVNGPAARQCLVEGAPQDQRNILLHKGNGWERWSRLEEAVRTGTAPGPARKMRSPQELRAFICGMADVARLSARSILEKTDLSRHRLLLDVGAGPGTYAITLLEEFPSMRARLFDLPEVLPITREHVEAAGLQDRVELIAGDFTRNDFPPGYDLALLSNIVHSFAPDINRGIIRRIHQGMARGGCFILKDFIVPPERTGPPFSLMFALHMLLGSEGGDVYSSEDVQEWTREAGFTPGELLDLTGQTRLWVVNKPEQD